jgi:hypothetical protein
MRKALCKKCIVLFSCPKINREVVVSKMEITTFLIKTKGGKIK